MSAVDPLQTYVGGGYDPGFPTIHLLNSYLGLLVVTGIAFLTSFISQASFWLLESFSGPGEDRMTCRFQSSL